MIIYVTHKEIRRLVWPSHFCPLFEFWMEIFKKQTNITDCCSVWWKIWYKGRAQGSSYEYWMYIFWVSEADTTVWWISEKLIIFNLSPYLSMSGFAYIRVSVPSIVKLTFNLCDYHPSTVSHLSTSFIQKRCWAKRGVFPGSHPQWCWGRINIYVTN